MSVVSIFPRRLSHNADRMIKLSMHTTVVYTNFVVYLYKMLELEIITTITFYRRLVRKYIALLLISVCPLNNTIALANLQHCVSTYIPISVWVHKLRHFYSYSYSIPPIPYIMQYHCIMSSYNTYSLVIQL